jgi:hypothetical protein
MMSRLSFFAFALTASLVLSNQPMQASTQTTLSIIMTTLGTDGTPVSTTTELPAGSTVTIQSQACETPGGPVSTNPGVVNPPISNTNSDNTGATGNPNPDPTTTDDTVPAPSPGSGTTNDTPVTEEPTVPPPPVVLPPSEGPIVPDTEPVNNDDTPSVPVEVTTGTTDVAQTPEPGTITLLGLAALGGIGYARRRKTA